MFLKQYKEAFIKFSETLKRGGEKLVLSFIYLCIYIKLDLPIVLCEIWYERHNVDFKRNLSKPTKFCMNPWISTGQIQKQ